MSRRETSEARVATPNRTVETIRAHARPALHFHAIHSHSTMGTTMLKTATTTMTPTLTAVTAPTTTPGTCDPGLFRSAENPGAAFTKAITPTIPLISDMTAPAYIRETARWTDLGGGCAGTVGMGNAWYTVTLAKLATPANIDTCYCTE